MKTDWIQTFTGKKIFPLEPQLEDICIEDIAHSLSMQCRFVGHCKQFYSVAQHSVIMAREWFNYSGDYARYALLHDASEAYLSDLPRPLKYLPDFYFYRNAERVLQEMIYTKFGLNPDEPYSIKTADHQLLCEEAMSKKIMSPLHPDWSSRCAPVFKISPVSPNKAEQLFLETFNNLFT